MGLFTHESIAAKIARKVTLRLANNIAPVKRLITESLTESDLERFSPINVVNEQFPVPPFVAPAKKIVHEVSQRIPDRVNLLKRLGVM
ncbi:hypothetical protein [Neptunomonas sp.]|uniref:hypothetical protein n=1 Tax=Neptunomonas sp. TaxID=1971898 RepID=UPI0025ED22AA|nr:hypothetical protein [Neptunomonas sp.]